MILGHHFSQAEKFALEDKLPSSARTAAGSQRPLHESPIYQDELRRMTLKRKRDEQLDPALCESVNVTVWEQRLYVSIITSNKVTTVSEFVKRSDGRPGEVEATGQVRVGDIISQINGHRVSGLDSASVSGMIKSARRPLVIVFLRPRAGHQLQERVSRAEDVLESESRAEAETETVERSHRSSAAAASAAANVVHITNSSPPPSAQAVDTTASPAANAPVPAPQSAAVASSPAYPEDGQQSQPYEPPSHQAERQSAPVHAYSNPPVVVPQQRYPQQQQSQVYSDNQYIQQYPVAAAAAQAAAQSAYEALSDPHQSLRVNLTLKQQRRAGMPNQWNSAYGRQQARATAYGTSMIPVPQPNSSYNPYLTGAHVSTSHLRPQYQAPQVAHPQQFVASQHSSAMLQQYSQQQAQPTRTRWANGVIVGNFPPGGSGSSMYSSSSTATPARTMAPEYSRSSVADYRSTQQPAVTAQGMMPAHQYTTASSSLQQSRPKAADYYDSAAAESSGPSFSTSESRFSVVEPVQEQQNHSAGGAVEDDDDGTESDEPPDYDEPIGRFELEDDLDDEEKQLAADLGMDVAPASTGKAPSSSFLSASSVAADLAETEEASSFLSPNKPSFVAKLPQNIGNQYVSDIMPPLQQQHVESTLMTADGEECVVVEIYRTRLYVTLGSLGTWIAITSFVRGKNGEIGEIEESGKVFIGDTIYAINGYPVNQGASPTDVARVVTNLPRPFKLYFQRATWDTLEGNT